MRLLRRKKTKEETCAEKGHRFDDMPQVMENVPLGTGGLAHTTLVFSVCTRCWRAHEEWGDNSMSMTEAARQGLREMFFERGHEVFLAEIEFWEED